MIKTDFREKRASKLPPEDPIGERFCHWFNHGWNFIYKSEKGWTTETRYPLEPRNLWSWYQNTESILGLRFGKTTNYCMIDIDRGSKYHYANGGEIMQITQALEAIGLVRSVLMRSSESNGLHLYYFLPEEVSTIQLAVAIKQSLLANKIEIKQGQVEVFPNVKAYSKRGEKPTNYNGHRLPLQTGSYILNSSFTPYSNNLANFLDLAETTSEYQDMALLKKRCAKFYAENRKKRNGNIVELWRSHLLERINQGWTGKSQTNNLLRDIGIYGKVFLQLSDEDAVAEYIAKTAPETKGFREFCGHIQDIAQRASEWARSVCKRYYCYGTEKRQTTSYKEMVREATETHNQKQQTKVREAISLATQMIRELPGKVTERIRAIQSKLKELYGHEGSLATLYKHIDIWHPQKVQAKVVKPTEPSEPTTRPEKGPMTKKVATEGPDKDLNTCPQEEKDLIFSSSQSKNLHREKQGVMSVSERTTDFESKKNYTHQWDEEWDEDIDYDDPANWPANWTEYLASG